MEIKVDKNIPVPQKRSKYGRWQEFFNGLEVGDSFIMPSDITQGASHSLFARYGRVVTRNTSEGLRVWVIEKFTEVKK